MTRRLITFECEGNELAATLDDASGSTGLVIVSGGNEIRSGAFAGQARLAADISAAGFPVFRFDRRGVGDSEGENLGFESSAPDIAAAIAAFRSAVPSLKRIVAYGNCDAASALMLQSGEGFDGLILSNPWVFDDAVTEQHSPSAVRSRYREKLLDPSEIKRLLTGGVSFRKLVRGIAQIAGGQKVESTLFAAMKDGLSGFDGNVEILVAERDRTAQAFLDSWDDGDALIQRCAGASHAYAEPDSFAWLSGQIREFLANEQARQLDMR